MYDGDRQKMKAKKEMCVNGLTARWCILRTYVAANTHTVHSPGKHLITFEEGKGSSRRQLFPCSHETFSRGQHHETFSWGQHHETFSRGNIMKRGSETAPGKLYEVQVLQLVFVKRCHRSK